MGPIKMQPKPFLDLNQPAISSGGLKALFIGSDLENQPEILKEIAQKFELDYAKLPSRYPYDHYLDLLDWLQIRLYPNEGVTAGFEQLGRNITKGFFQRPVGQVLKRTIGLLGPQRAMTYFFRIAGGALPFGRFEVMETKPGFVRAILYNVPGSPEIMRGMGLESMAVAGISGGTIQYTKLSPIDTQFIAQW